MDKKTLTVVGVSVAVGFLGDVIMYSYAKSGSIKNFRVHMPTGVNLVTVLALGIVTGFAVDALMNPILNALKDDEEKKLDKLVAQELAKVRAGQYAGKDPKAVLWAVTGV